MDTKSTLLLILILPPSTSIVIMKIDPTLTNNQFISSWFLMVFRSNYFCLYFGDYWQNLEIKCCTTALSCHEGLI